MKKYYSILLLFVITLASCEPWRKAAGRVYDQDTHLPIEGVRVSFKGDSISYVVSDSIGVWELVTIMNKRYPKNVYIILDNPGYISKEYLVTKPKENVVYLEKQSH